MYDPKTGRFTGPDPTGLIGGPNLYAYCHNDPVNYKDSSGTIPVFVGVDPISPFHQTGVLSGVAEHVRIQQERLARAPEIYKAGYWGKYEPYPWFERPILARAWTGGGEYDDQAPFQWLRYWRGAYDAGRLRGDVYGGFAAYARLEHYRRFGNVIRREEGLAVLSIEFDLLTLVPILRASWRLGGAVLGEAKGLLAARGTAMAFDETFVASARGLGVRGGSLLEAAVREVDEGPRASPWCDREHPSEVGAHAG